MTTTVIRAKIRLDRPATLALVVSVNPFSSIQHPAQAAPAAYYQTYELHANGRTTLHRDEKYKTELEAAEYFDRVHPEQVLVTLEGE